MSDAPSQPARPVSLFTIIFLFALFAIFLLAIRWFYTPATVAPQNAAAENLNKEREWRATAADRQKVLLQQRETEAKQTSGYAWIDQKAGVVQLPVTRAMELTVQKYGAKK